MLEVRRESDGELCGFVDEVDGVWRSHAVFGGFLGEHGSTDDAVSAVLEHGLSSLARHWHYRADVASEWQIVCIQEASTSSVRIALDYYSMPGVPTLTLSSTEVLRDACLVLNPAE